MQEIIGRVAAAAGIGEDAARKAVAVMLDAIDREGPGESVARLFAAMPGAAELAAEERGRGRGLMGALAGTLTAAYGKLVAAGLDGAQMRAAGETLFEAAREAAGEDTVADIVKSIPGLSKLM